jgi:transposase-like protein
MPSETPRQLKWKDLDGQQKYEVVELARKQGVQVKELCQAFGVSRQTLYRAMEVADKAAIEALSPKPKGRPPVPLTQKEIMTLRTRNKELEQDLKRQKLKNEVAQALLDLQRKFDRGQKLPGEKKPGRQPDLSNAKGSGQPGSRGRVVHTDDG